MFSRFCYAVPPVYSGISKKQCIFLLLCRSFTPVTQEWRPKMYVIFCVTHPKRSGLETQQNTFHHELVPRRSACCLEANNLRY